MTSNPQSDLPGFTYTPALDEVPRAGTVAEQIAWQDRAWEMVEVYKAPSGYNGARLSNAWLGAHDWRVQLYTFSALCWRPGTMSSFVSAAIRAGHSALYGTRVSPGARPTAVWRIPAEEDAVERFFEAHYHTFSVLFPADRSFAVQGNDGDFAVFAGSEAFLREALPPEAIGHSFTAEVVDGVEAEYGEGCMEGILAHYAPFMLER
jgi:hypothetical protein